MNLPLLLEAMHPNRLFCSAKIYLSGTLLSMSMVLLANPSHAAPAPRPSCPSEFEPLVSRLLRELPAYTNRITTRLRPANSDTRSYMILTSRPEFEPLPLSPTAIASPEAPTSDPRQLFITTLERRYQNKQVLQIQEYHWIFLTRSPNGWRLALMFSRTGSYPLGEPITPPRDSSQGAIAQAIRTWLADCRSSRG